MMRVLQLNKLYPPFFGGVEKVVQDIAEGLKNRTDMRVLVLSETHRTTEDMVNGVPVHRSGNLLTVGSMPISFRYLRDVRKAVKDADIVQLHMPFPWGDLALRFSGYKGKLAVLWHSDIVRQKKMMLLYKPLMNWTLRRADCVFVATEGHINGSAYLGPYREKCRIVPFGVDQEYLEEGAAVAAREPLRNGPVNFLFIGRLVYYKGCDVLIDAFAKMETKDATLTLAGGGALMDQLMAQAKELGIWDRVRFLDRVPREELKQCLANCDVFVLPSVARSEAFGLVQMEAMAYGKPVINTNLPSGVPFVSLHGVTGFTVEPGDAQELAKAMDILANNGELRRQYGQNARRRVEGDFTLMRMMNGVMTVYNELLNNNGEEAK